MSLAAQTPIQASDSDRKQLFGLCLQQRKAHILCWYRPRKRPDNYVAIKAIPRQVPGCEPRQRPLSQKVEPLPAPVEDHCYQSTYMARIRAELVRPDVTGPKWGGYTTERMRIAFLEPVL